MFIYFLQNSGVLHIGTALFFRILHKMYDRYFRILVLR